MTAKARDRSPRPTVGKIKCPEGHNADIKKQTNGKLYVYCEDCETKYTYDGKGGQDFLLTTGSFKGANDTAPTEEPKEKTVSVNVDDSSPSPEKKRGIFSADPDMDF